MAVNHLFIGRRVASSNYRRNRHVTQAPSIAAIYPDTTPHSLVAPIPKPKYKPKSLNSSKVLSKSTSVDSTTTSVSTSTCNSHDEDSSSSQPTSPHNTEKRVRTVSGTSLYSEASLHVPDESDAASMTSSIAPQQDPESTDCESIDAGSYNDITDERQADLMTSHQCSDSLVTDSGFSNMSSGILSDTVITDTSDILLSDSDTVHDELSDKEISDCVENCEVIDEDQAEHSRDSSFMVSNSKSENNNNKHSRGEIAAYNHSPLLNSEGEDTPDESLLASDQSKQSHKVCSKCNKIISARHKTCKTCNMPTLLQLSKSASSDEDFVEKLQRKNMIDKECERLSHLKNSDKKSEYVAKLTYIGHKNGQQAGSSSSVIKPRSFSEPPKIPVAHVPPLRPITTFNPFPSRKKIVGQSRTQNGIKLGLYSPDIKDPINVAKKGSSLNSRSMPTRAQINSCLHRQYMVEIKQQSQNKQH